MRAILATPPTDCLLPRLLKIARLRTILTLLHSESKRFPFLHLFLYCTRSRGQFVSALEPSSQPGRGRFTESSGCGLHHWYSTGSFTSALRLQTFGADEGLKLVLEQQGIPTRNGDIYALLQESIKKKDLATGRRVHLLLQRHGLDCAAYWGDHLIRMFASCENLLEANQAFHKVKKPSVYTWSAIISAHAKLAEDSKAIQLFYDMLQVGEQPDKITFLSTLKASRNLGSAWHTRLIHDRIIRSGFQTDNIIANALTDVYAKCGNLMEAHSVFDVMPHRDVVSWCALITGYAAYGQGSHALELFQRMQQEGITPDRVIFISVLKACGSIHSAWQARMIHEEVIRNRHDSDLFIGSSLVDIYAKCGCLQEARKVFDKLQNRNAVSWVTLIAGYAQHGDGFHAMELLEKMQQSGIDVDRVAFLSILKACGSLAAIRQGRLVHRQIIENGFLPDKVLGNTLVDMYARCGSLEDAHSVFEKLSNRDVVSWGAMIAGYGGCGLGLVALSLFDRMQQDGVKPNVVIFLPVLNACSSLENLECGMLIHEQIIKQSFESDVAIGNKLVDMYAKRGRVEEAEKVFRAMQYRDVVSWGTMILGCAEHGHGPSALELYEEMWQECVEADKVIFLCVLKACGSTGAIEQARRIHYQIISSGLDQNTEIGNTLVDMYAKIGTLEEARRAFDQLRTRDVVSWAAMIAGYSRCGNFQVAGQCLEDMQRQGLQPHDGIFTSLLVACTHAGVLNEGHRYFKLMVSDHGITPTIEHYNCIIDLLGRVGRLKEAIALLTTMHVPSDVIVWTSLLTSCRTYHSVDLGRRCFNEVLKWDPDDASGYILMSNIYADAGMWEDVDKLRGLRKCAGAQKKRGMTWVEVNNKVHEFIVGDKCHVMSDSMFFKFQRLARLIKRSAYLPQLDLVVEPTFDE